METKILNCVILSVAPFNSMKERVNGVPSDNPGPGDYASEKVKVVATVKDMMSNSFTTKVSITASYYKTNMACVSRFQDSVQQLRAQASTSHLHTSRTQGQAPISKV